MTLSNQESPQLEETVMEKGLKQKLLPPIVLALCVGLAYWITQSNPPASKGFAKKPSPLLVNIQTLVAEDYQQNFRSFGRVQAKQHTDLFPLVSGQVVEVFPVFESGRRFKQGEKLLQLEKSDYEVELQIALSDLATAELNVAEEEARAAQAKRDWQVQKRRNPSAKINDFALRKPQLKSAKAGLNAAQARVSLAKTNLERTTVVAPFSGRVEQTKVGIGSVVTGGTILASLYDTSILEVRLPIANDDLAFIDLSAIDGAVLNKETNVSLENTLAVPAEMWEGRLDRSDASLDSSSQQLYLVAQIVQTSEDEHKQALKIGQFLQAEIYGQSLSNIIRIPNSAIYQGSYVYVVKEMVTDNEVMTDADKNTKPDQKDQQYQIQRRDIKIRWRNDAISIIESGLSPGDSLVTTPLGQVTSGTLVKLNNGSHSTSDEQSGVKL